MFAQQPSAIASVLFIEDGSITTPHPCLLDWKPQALESVGILVLRRNLGHQRAIAVGLAYLAEKWTADAVVVMDSDGKIVPKISPSSSRQWTRAGAE